MLQWYAYNTHPLQQDTIARAGHAACARAWRPKEGTEPSAPEFAPVLALSEVDGSRKSCIVMNVGGARSQ